MVAMRRGAARGGELTSRSETAVPREGDQLTMYSPGKERAHGKTGEAEDGAGRGGEVVTAVDEALGMQLHEGFVDRLAQVWLQSKPLAAPVARRAKPAELADPAGATGSRRGGRQNCEKRPVLSTKLANNSLPFNIIII